MSRRYLVAFLTYLVPTFILGFVWHLVAFHDLYQQLNIYRPDPIIPLGFGSMIVQGAIFAWAYPRLRGDDPQGWLRAGLRAGALFGLLSWSFTTMAVAAKHPMTSVGQFVAVETAFTAVQFGLVGPLMAWAWRGDGQR